MNTAGEQYLDYTSDIYDLTNENIMTLREDMQKANEKPEKM